MTAELPSPTDVVQAAGGLVVRRQDGLLEIVVVHRPVHQDWSFPKGKLEAGETFEMAALREVRGRDGHDLPPPPLHRPHRVRRPEGSAQGGGLLDHGGRRGVLRPNEEVDELRWLSLEEATRLLSYPRDRELVAVLMAADQVEPVI